MTTHEDAFPDSAFLFWQPFLEAGGLVTLTPYHTKYGGGASPRDAMAMAKVFGVLIRLHPEADVKITDRLLLGDPMRNLVLIGSGSANAVVRKFLQELKNRGNPLSFSLGKGFWVDAPRQRAGLAMNLISKSREGEGDIGAQFNIEDYGIIARAPNPFDPSKVVTFVAGIHGYGTLAAAEVFFGREYHAEIKKHLDSDLIRFNPETDADAVVEVIFKTTIGWDPEDLEQTIRPLKRIDIQFVRVDRDLNRQSPAEPPASIWKHQEPAPRPRMNPHRFSIIFDNVQGAGSAQKAIVRLEGQFNRTQFVDLAFTDGQCDNYNTRINQALAGGEHPERQIRKVGEELAAHLAPAMRLAPESTTREDELVYAFRGPAHMLRIPFEVTRLDNNYYLAEVHPVVRSINQLLCKKRALNAEVLEELRQRQERLQVLVVVSNPRKDLPAAASEADRIMSCLQLFESQIETSLLDGRNATVDAFKQKIASRRYHVLHYVGHSHWADNPRRSYLLLQDTQGIPQPLFLDGLSNIFRDAESPLSFCYLSSCRSAAVGDALDAQQYDFLGIADSLVRAGIPAVLAYRTRVDDELAKDFARHFYRNLWQPWREFNLPRALLYARQEIFGRWSVASFTPVLVMQD